LAAEPNQAVFVTRLKLGGSSNVVLVALRDLKANAVAYGEDVEAAEYREVNRRRQ